MLGIYFNKYYNLSDVKRSKMDPKYGLSNLMLEEYDYSRWFRKKSDDVTLKNDKKELDEWPPLEGDEEEVKEEKGIKILTPNKLLTIPPVVLAQIRAGNNSYKLENEIKIK